MLSGADRKHKQDREKVMKRPIMEQEKFSPQYDCTVLTDLSVDSIYIPPSRGISPVQVPLQSPSHKEKSCTVAVLNTTWRCVIFVGIFNFSFKN
jgi:transcription factor CP2-like protein